jgi:MarR family transcriptional regulator, organic hydroperoxide resistance regulator
MQQAAPAAPIRKFDSPEQEAFLGLWRTYDRLKAIEDEVFSRHGITAQQYNALRLLRATYPETIPTLTLGGRLISRAPDITRLLNGLFERGLVCRERPPDNRRTVRVAITDAGLELLAELADEVQASHHRQLGHLNPAELRTLIDLLRKTREPHEAPESTWR